MRHELLVDGFASHIDNLALFADNLAVAYLDGCLRYFDSIARGIQTECAVDGGVALSMIVTKEDDVETGYRLGHLSGDVFLVVGGDDTAFPATMEESYDDVGFLLLLQHLEPLAGTLDHLFKVQTSPQTLVEPVGNGWCQHT